MDECQLGNPVSAAFQTEANKKLIGQGKSRIASGHTQEWNFHLCEWNLLSTSCSYPPQLMNSSLTPECIYKINSGPDGGIWTKSYFLVSKVGRYNTSLIFSLPISEFKASQRNSVFFNIQSLEVTVKHPPEKRK